MPCRYPLATHISNGARNHYVHLGPTGEKTTVTINYTDQLKFGFVGKSLVEPISIASSPGYSTPFLKTTPRSRGNRPAPNSDVIFTDMGPYCSAVGVLGFGGVGPAFVNGFKKIDVDVDRLKFPYPLEQHEFIVVGGDE